MKKISKKCGTLCRKYGGSLLSGDSLNVHFKSPLYWIKVSLVRKKEYEYYDTYLGAKRIYWITFNHKSKNNLTGKIISGSRTISAPRRSDLKCHILRVLLYDISAKGKPIPKVAIVPTKPEPTIKVNRGYTFLPLVK